MQIGTSDQWGKGMKPSTLGSGGQGQGHTVAIIWSYCTTISVLMTAVLFYALQLYSLLCNSWTSLGMLIPGYLDTRVPCGLPGSRPGSRETSDLPSYRDRLHQSTDCPCGHIQASTALAAAENAERPVC